MIHSATFDFGCSTATQSRIGCTLLPSSPAKWQFRQPFSCHFAFRNSQASYLGGVFCAFSAMSVDKKHCAICWSALFKIVLGLMCPGGPARRGESQNEAKSRRFGMDLPSRAFYEGVNPKTIWNNCHECTHRHFLTLHVRKTGRGKQGEKCHTDHPSFLPLS